MGQLAAAAGTLRTSKAGHVSIKCVNHAEFGTGWIRRSHFVWWKYRKQRVPSGWVLHHKDTNASRDMMSNLQLMTFAAHSKLHATQRHKEGKLGSKMWTAESHARFKETMSVVMLGNNYGHYSKGFSGHKHTEVSRKKMGSPGKTHPMFGKHLTKETRHKISVARIGTQAAETTKAKMSISQKARQAREKEEKVLLQSGYGHPWRIKDLDKATQEMIA